MVSATLNPGHARTGRRLFDSHRHIIDHRFPLVANQGYTPPDFRLDAYRAQSEHLGVVPVRSYPAPFRRTIRATRSTSCQSLARAGSA
jgi:hypothetical protein